MLAPGKQKCQPGGLAFLGGVGMGECLAFHADDEESGDAPEVVDVGDDDALGAVVLGLDGVTAVGMVGEEFDALAVGGNHFYTATVKGLEIGIGVGQVEQLAAVEKPLLLEQAPLDELGLGAADVMNRIHVGILTLDAQLLIGALLLEAGHILLELGNRIVQLVDAGALVRDGTLQIVDDGGLLVQLLLHAGDCSGERLVLGIALGKLSLQIVNLVLLLRNLVFDFVDLIHHQVFAGNGVALILEIEGDEAVLGSGNLVETALDLVEHIQSLVVIGLELLVGAVQGIYTAEKLAILVGLLYALARGEKCCCGEQYRNGINKLFHGVDLC